MAIVVSAGSGGSFQPAPAGVHQGVAIDVVDLGTQETTWGPKHLVRLVWEIDEQMRDGRRFLVSKRYTASLHEKANLRKDLESWRGRPFTEQELAGFDLETVIGVNAQLNVQHSKDGLWANVVSLMPLLKGMPKLQAAGTYVRVCDREAENGMSEHEGPVELDQIPF